MNEPTSGAKNNSKQQQKARINETLFAIHGDLAHPWTAQELAGVAAYSPHHFQRVFKSVTGENLNIYLRRTRLEKAANLLIYHPDISILEIAQKCGFQSPASFTHRFKEWFGDTPKHWRNGGYEQFTQRVTESHQDEEVLAKLKLQNIKHRDEFNGIKIVTREPTRVAYVRHQGYNRSISQAWRKLVAWAESEDLLWQQQEMIGLYHSNPNIVPLPQCRYVACIQVPNDVWRHQEIGIMTIPGGLHAQLAVSGHYGDLLPVLHRVLHFWLPHSGYRLALTPAFVSYQRNQFLQTDDRFELELYLPVKAF